MAIIERRMSRAEANMLAEALVSAYHGDTVGWEKYHLIEGLERDILDMEQSRKQKRAKKALYAVLAVIFVSIMVLFPAAIYFTYQDIGQLVIWYVSWLTGILVISLIAVLINLANAYDI